jgi:hypothetical protein
MRWLWGLVAIACAIAGLSLFASAPDGAIFTTLPDGSRVNYNIYAAKSDVYLDGGPGDQAPAGAAGLPEGDYVFQITDPSGKELLSVDPAGCRQFHVNEFGVISNAIPFGANCQHAEGIDQDHGAAPENARTIQMCGKDVLGLTPDPTDDCFLDTPNPGGEYKAWITPLADFLDGCELLGVDRAVALSLVSCGPKRGGNAHGFVGRHSKTDNFKVGGDPREIDTIFFGTDGRPIDGLSIIWTDTHGASNKKWSYEDLSLDVHHEAHVEDVEDGTHTVSLYNQPGCTIGSVYVDGARQPKTGPQNVSIQVRNSFRGGTIFVYVYCR